MSSTFSFLCCAIVLALVADSPVQGQSDPLAEYAVRFDSTWSDASHPALDFPNTAHFSGLVGGTHDNSVSFWQSGGLANPIPRVRNRSHGRRADL